MYLSQSKKNQVSHDLLCEPAIGYTGSKATDEKATSSLFVSCLLVGEKVAFLSAQKATMKIFIFGHATGWICLKMLF